MFLASKVLVLVTFWGSGIPTPQRCHWFHPLIGPNQYSFLCYGVGGGVPTFFLDPYSLYPGQNLDIIFTLLYYQCAYVTSWCVWRTSIPLDLHTLVYVQRYIEIQTINAPCVDASHPSARGDMADSNPLFLEKRHTLCSSPFFYFREVKKNHTRYPLQPEPRDTSDIKL